MRARLAAVVVAALVTLACRDESAASRDDILAATGGDPVAGQGAIARYGCGSCHVIPGVARARGLVGPPLTDMGRRSYIAGRLTNTPAHLATWIRRPDSVEPGTAMPMLGVSEQDARNIAAYLYLETASGGLGPRHLLPASLLKKE